MFKLVCVCVCVLESNILDVILQERGGGLLWFVKKVGDAHIVKYNNV